MRWENLSVGESAQAERLSIPIVDDPYDRRIVVEPIPPTWRDLWAILRRRYTPRVRIYSPLNLKWADGILRETWTDERLAEQLNRPYVMFDQLENP